MATKTLRLASGQDGNFAASSESDQTAASRTDGWTVAKTSSGLSSEFDAGTKQASGSFSSQSTTPKPASFLTGSTANAIKSPSAYEGIFAATAWTLTFAVRAGTASSQAGRIRLRVFASVNADGSSARELTGSTQVGTTSSALSTTADVTTVVTWTPASAITLNGEYLFFVIAWEITTASGSNSGDVLLRTGQSAGGTRFVTSSFTPLVAPAQISATSTMGGDIQKAPKNLTPSQISATSTMSGSVLRVKKIIPAQISATSSVSAAGGVGPPPKQITPATINATSNVWIASGVIKLNGLVNDYVPNEGTDNATLLQFDPTAQPWVANKLYTARSAGTNSKSVPVTRFASRNVGQGIYSSVKVGSTYMSALFASGGTTGSSQPATTGGVFDGDLYYPQVITWKDWTPSTVYSTNDYIIRDGSTFFCLLGGTSVATEPNWASVAPKYGDGVFEGSPGVNPVWLRQDIAVLWSANTYYHYRSSPLGGQPEYYDEWPYISSPTKSLWVNQGPWYEFKQSGSSTPTPAKWTPDGDVMWTLGSYPGSNYAGQAADDGGGKERLVITGIAPASTNGKQITIKNVGTGDMSVVLADKTGLSGTTGQSTHAFDFGGTDVVLQAGQAVIVAYNTSTGFWSAKVLVPAQISATSTMSGSITSSSGSTKSITPATISATSSLSGSVTATKRITPATIAATSTLSASGPIVIRAIRPAQISATSVLSGSVSVRRRITPATINATSTLTGSIRVTRRIAPAQISATSTLSANVSKQGLIGGVINATSTLSGSIRVIRRVAPAQISATSTLAATVGRRFTVVPAQISATSTLTGSIRVTRRVAPAQISATSTLTATVGVRRRFTPAQISATSTLSGNVQRQGLIGGVINATSTMTANIRVVRAIQPVNILATSTMTATVIRRIAVSGLIAATSTVSASVRIRRGVIPGVILATSTLSGAVRVTRRVTAAQILATSTLSGGLVGIKKFTGVISATSTVAGRVAVIRRIAGNILATSTLTGAVRIIVYIVPAQISSTSTVSGRIVMRWALGGQILATSSVYGTITRLAGEAPGTDYLSAGFPRAVLIGAELPMDDPPDATLPTPTIRRVS